MTFLSFISCSRTYFSIYMHNSRFLCRKTLRAPFEKATVSRLYVKDSKVAALKHSLRSASGCLPKHHHNLNANIIFCLKEPVLTLEFLRCFRTSESRYFHPAFWFVFRPVLKFLAVISGRAFRKWWRDLPPDKKKYFLGVIKENRKNIAFFVLASVILSLIYYVSHIEETPITKRKRFIAFNSRQLEKINEFEFQQIMTKMQSQILPDNHPYTHRVKAVVQRILTANQDIKEMRGKKWGVSIINSSIENTFVLPIGHVFVFTGMLSLCPNDDQLGTVISHEIAHCIQNHGAENVSFAHLLDLISIVIIAAIWALVPSDMMSLLTHWLYQKSMKILFELPYNREIEKEADKVGLQLAAKACFDVRESSAFWAKMAIFHSTVGQGPEIEFLSTHPSHEKRSEYLDSIMDEAIDLRQKCGCPKLRPADPRSNTEVLTKALEAARQKYLSQHPKPGVHFHV